MLLDVDFLEVGVAMTGVDATAAAAAITVAAKDDDNDDALTSTSLHLLPFFPGAPLPVVVCGVPTLV